MLLPEAVILKTLIAEGQLVRCNLFPHLLDLLRRRPLGGLSRRLRKTLAAFAASNSLVEPIPRVPVRGLPSGDLDARR